MQQREERRERRDRDRDGDGDGGFSEKVVFINRVSKVVKGGRRFSFSAVVVVGDGDGEEVVEDVDLALGDAGREVELVAGEQARCGECAGDAEREAGGRHRGSSARAAALSSGRCR